MECFNYNCEYCKNDKCESKVFCNKRSFKILNYEEEYNKLKEENENLTKRNETQNQSIKEMLNEIERLKKLNNQGYMEQMNINLKEKDKQLETLGNSVNEYYYNWIESQKEREKEKDKNRILKDKVEVLKESVISLTELI